MNKESQEHAIFRKLKSGVILTPMDALLDKNIRSFRLSARIYDLRNMGHTIETTMMKTKNGKYVAGYRLINVGKRC